MKSKLIPSTRLRPASDAAPWVTVLAGGDGTRLACITTSLYGRAIPKQFAVLDGDRSLLQTTVERALDVTAPERVIVVANQEYGSLAQRQLDDYPGVRLVLQPRNAGTAAGILLPVCHVISEDPAAKLMFYPSDHHFDDPRPLKIAAEAAIASVDDHLAIIATAPEGPSEDYGWVLPGQPVSESGALRRTRTFVEKPSRAGAVELLAAGALWNTFILAARADVMRDIIAERLPATAAAFDRLSPGGGSYASSLSEIYRNLPAADFSKEILQVSSRVVVAELPACGWTDLGTPDRALATFPALRARLTQAALRTEPGRPRSPSLEAH